MPHYLTRRTLLRSSALLATGLASGALLAACGGGAAGAPSGPTTSNAASNATASAAPSTAANQSAASPSTTAVQASTVTATPTTSAAASTTASSASASPAAGGTVSLRIGSWLNRPTNQAVYNDQLLTPYQKLRPEVTITVEYTNGTTAHYTKMLAETAAGDPPDIVEVGYDHVQDFATKKAIVELDPLIAQSKIKLDDYVQQALELNRFPQGTGKYWAWQTMLGIGVVYYNKTLFDKAGVPYPTDSLDYQTTLLDMAQKLSKKGADEANSFWGFSPDYYWQSILYSFGFRMVSDDGKKALVDSPESIAAHQYWYDLLNRYQVAFPSTAWKTFNVQEDPFETNHVAMSLDASYEVQAWRKIAALDWDVVMPPKGPAGQYSMIAGAPGHGLSPLSKHQDAAWQFLTWWIVNETPDQVVNPGNLPSRITALNSWAAEQLKQNPVPANIGKFVDIASKLGKPIDNPPHSGDVWDAYNTARKNIMAGKTGVADGLHALAQQIDGILAQP